MTKKTSSTLSMVTKSTRDIIDDAYILSTYFFNEKLATPRDVLISSILHGAEGVEKHILKCFPPLDIDMGTTPGADSLCRVFSSTGTETTNLLDLIEKLMIFWSKEKYTHEDETTNIVSPTITDIFSGIEGAITPIKMVVECVIHIAHEFPEITPYPWVPEKKEDDKDSENHTIGKDLEFASDLVSLALDGELDPFIGREKEIRKIETILCKRTKNNPILIGPPGVGKTALVEAIAQKIADRKIHPKLKDKRIYMVDIAGMLANSSLRGQFEGKLKSLIDAIEHDKNAILFIDEAHTMVGAGAGGQEGGLDMANILKPALSRKRFQAIAATTEEEYEKIASDGALARRFNPIYIKESTSKETISILKGVRSMMEVFHSTQITDRAIEETVRLSSAHIHGLMFPDKALDLLDEACTLSVARPVEATHSEKAYARVIEWEGIFQELVSKGKMGKAAQANKTLKAAKTAASKIISQISRPSKTTEVDVQHAIYDRLGSEFAMYDGGSKDNMQKVAKSLEKNVAGQDKAIHELTEYLRTGYSLARNPLAIVVLVSTGGAGKTEICEQLGEKIFSKIVHIDMAKYKEAATATELFGSSRGYVDSHKGGILINAVRHQPNTLILMENIDKAHPAIVSSITTALKTGGIKDGVGRTASLKDAMVVFTINVEGSSKSIGFGDPKKKSPDADLSKTLPPDLLSVCKVVSLNTLSKEDVPEVFRIQIKKLSKRVDREITYDDSILRVILKEFDSVKGGRSVVDSVRKHIEPIISDNPGYYPLFILENTKGKIVATTAERKDISNG